MCRVTLFIRAAVMFICSQRHRHCQILLSSVFLWTIVIMLFSVEKAQSSEKGKHPLLIISFDGFRWDYLKRAPTPNFHKVVEQGVYAVKGLQNMFVTSTLTNHWSMVTGLYPESHGIIENNMFDPVLNKTYIPLYKNKSVVNDNRFYDTGAEPIWVTNQLQSGGRSGSVMWWGAENSIKGIRPTHHLPFDLSVQDIVRADTMIKWFKDENPINLGLLYFSEPDHIAHKTGPDSQNVTNMITHLDGILEYVFSQLKENHLFDNMNIIITSDHGFAPVSRKRLIFLDEIVDPNLYTIVRYSPVAAIIPHEGSENLVYEKLKAASEKSRTFQVFWKADIPDRLYYKNNKRVTPIIAIANITYSFISNMPAEKFKLAGTHGFDNKYQDMHPFFMARGPSFKQGFTVETFSLIDLYPLMCHLLGLKPAANNGTMEIVSQLLLQGNEIEVWTFSNYVYIYMLVMSIFGAAFFFTVYKKNFCKKRSKFRHQEAGFRRRDAFNGAEAHLLKEDDGGHEIL